MSFYELFNFNKNLKQDNFLNNHLNKNILTRIYIQIFLKFFKCLHDSNFTKYVFSSILARLT